MNINEQLIAVLSKIASELEGIRSALEKGSAQPGSTDLALIGKGTASLLPTTSGGDGGDISGEQSLLAAMKPTKGAAVALEAIETGVKSYIGSNAYQGMQAMPYKKAEEYAEAAGMAGIDLTAEQGLNIRDFYRDLGRSVTHNKNVVDTQNSMLGPLQYFFQQKAQDATEYMQDLNVILYDYFDMNRKLNSKDVRGR